jgi:hypothetical protein
MQLQLCGILAYSLAANYSQAKGKTSSANDRTHRHFFYHFLPPLFSIVCYNFSRERLYGSPRTHHHRLAKTEGNHLMSKSQDAKKNTKKPPLKTADEKRKEKRAKKNK